MMTVNADEKFLVKYGKWFILKKNEELKLAGFYQETKKLMG